MLLITHDTFKMNQVAFREYKNTIIRVKVFSILDSQHVIHQCGYMFQCNTRQTYTHNYTSKINTQYSQAKTDKLDLAKTTHQ